MALAARKTYTPEEYLALEFEAAYRSELVNGEIYAMAGASMAHIRISSNLLGEIHQQLKGKPCRVYNSDLRVKVSATGMYTYPDVTVVCGLDQMEKDTLTNPTLIIEVLSPSTEAYDRGEKFAHYRQLPSLEEYVLVSQDKVNVEHYLRHGDDWLFSATDNIESALRLTSIDCIVPLSEIYSDVEFPAEPGLIRPQEQPGN